jgi:adenylate cyclase 7
LASIRRTYYLIITNHVFLPYPNRIQSCAATIIITSFEIVVTYISRRDNNCRADYLTLYSIADIIFYASSAMIGFQITFLLEIAIRRTFLNHKYCIQSTYKLNYEKEQQEQLLRSCFPQHLIEEVRGDVRELIVRVSKRQSEPFRPFKHLYVRKYDDVSILYADIVNSMNLTDKLNPAELVETLNELYGRFDELAEKYDCVRIKLLGDCYYCVSGLPEFDAEHAIKCLLMGLGMIKIIQSIRQSRNVDIDMRIGIHSGSVLSGLLGLRKWQFDIWSLDAMKASQMEHSGQPGFVHITQKTLDAIAEDDVRRQNLIITSTRQSDDSETTYLISERVTRTGDEFANSPRGRRNGQSEKLKAYIEKLRVSLLVRPKPDDGRPVFERQQLAHLSSSHLVVDNNNNNHAHKIAGPTNRERRGLHKETDGPGEQPEEIPRNPRESRRDHEDGDRRDAAR